MQQWKELLKDAQWDGNCKDDGPLAQNIMVLPSRLQFINLIAIQRISYTAKRYVIGQISGIACSCVGRAFLHETLARVKDEWPTSPIVVA